MVRTGEEGAEETQPYVQISFTGEIGDPERRIDLNPLLNLLRSRFLQRQLDELEKLEAARKRIEAEQAARKAEEERRAAEEQQVTPDEPPSTGTTSEPSSAPSPIAADPTPAPAQLPPPMQLVPQAAPRLGAPAAGAPGNKRSDAAPVTPLPEYRTLPNGTIVKIR